jgi:DNA repair protein RecN (Recombination protein N)
VAAVLAHADRCREERDRLEHSEEALEALEAELAATAREESDRAEALAAARREAAPRLAERVREELSALAMEDASFAVRLEPREALGATGGERVEFLIAPNAGVPPTPLRESASGGELSRVMLALMGIASAEGAPALVFDEVDAGVGGQTARAVGERLRALADGRQVLCITHLPQIASLAERHFRIEKEPGGELARTRVEAIAGPGVVEELCRMGARRHAEELLAAA